MSYARNPEHPLATACPFFPPEERVWLQRELADILLAELSMGPRTAKFEQEFAAFCGVPYGVAFPSGTSALEVALLALGIRPGDEVLVPVETFVATGMAVHMVGARPVFTEIASDTLAMDFADAARKITSRTKGAIIVHFGGLIAPGLPEFVRQMRARGLFVVEDAAHAHGAELNGERAGRFGDAACFSFFPTKIMTTGEGGMFVTASEPLARTARSLQNRGRDLGVSDERYALPGRNNRFTEIAAAMGLSQLRCLPEFLAARRRTAVLYDQGLAADGLFQPLRMTPGAYSSYWRYVTIPQVRLDRALLRKALAHDGIVIDWAYDPLLHLQPVFQSLYGTRQGLCPNSEELLSRHICLPIHARLRDEDVKYVVERLHYHTRQLAG